MAWCRRPITRPLMNTIMRTAVFALMLATALTQRAKPPADATVFIRLVGSVHVEFEDVDGGQTSQDAERGDEHHGLIHALGIATLVVGFNEPLVCASVRSSRHSAQEPSAMSSSTLLHAVSPSVHDDLANLIPPIRLPACNSQLNGGPSRHRVDQPHA